MHVSVYESLKTSLACAIMHVNVSDFLKTILACAIKHVSVYESLNTSLAIMHDSVYFKLSSCNDFGFPYFHQCK